MKREMKSARSLARKIITRLMITTLVGTGVAYGWLYLKAAHVQNYLEQRALVQQAREISDFIVVGEDGPLTLDLPPRLSEAYNSVKSSYRYAVRDEGRAHRGGLRPRGGPASGPAGEPAPQLRAEQRRHPYRGGRDRDHVRPADIHHPGRADRAAAAIHQCGGVQ